MEKDLILTCDAGTTGLKCTVVNASGEALVSVRREYATSYPRPNWAQQDPDVIVSVGQAGGETCINLERVAVNLNDCRIPDNEGNQPEDEPIIPDGPAAYFSTLPIKAMRDAILAAGIPAVVSNTAGLFICNHVFYGVRDLCEKNWPGKKSGFIHIPYLPEQVTDKIGTASMPLETAVKALTVALEVIAAGA